jgi:uncharacterized membrane protein
MENKSFFSQNIVGMILLVIPFILIVVFWNDLPEKIPMHWNVEGEVDRYGSKAFGILALPVFNVILFLLFVILPKIDPRQKNYRFFGTSYNIIRIGLNSFMLVLFIIILAASLGYELNIGLIVIYLTLTLFLVIGNLFGKIRPNYFLGLRTPWTLDNEEVWRKTHRLAGAIWVWSTVVMFIIAAVIPITIFVYVYFCYVGLIVLVPLIYSYKYHKDYSKANPNNE